MSLFGIFIARNDGELKQTIWITGATPDKWIIAADVGALRSGLTPLYAKINMTHTDPLHAWCEGSFKSQMAWYQ